MSFDPPPLPPIQPQWGQFQVWWQQVLGQLKTTLDAMQTALDALTAAQAAQAAADAAQTTANSAQSTASTVKRDDAITASYPAPGDVLTATDAGSDVTITVDAHSRVYGDISNVSVNSGTITGQPYSTDLYVYYDDVNRVGGSVVYHATSNPNAALPTKAAGRHYVGKVLGLAAGSPPTTGGSAPPSGGGSLTQEEIHSTL